MGPGAWEHMLSTSPSSLLFSKRPNYSAKVKKMESTSPWRGSNFSLLGHSCPLFASSEVNTLIHWLNVHWALRMLRGVHQAARETATQLTVPQQS